MTAPRRGGARTGTIQLYDQDEVNPEVLIDYVSRVQSLKTQEQSLKTQEPKESAKRRSLRKVQPDTRTLSKESLDDASCEESFHQCEPDIAPVATVEDLQSASSAVLWKSQWKGSECLDCIVAYLQSLVMTEASTKRKVWHIVLFVLLLYTGTLFPYRLCFLEFYVPDGIEIDRNWENFEIVVDVLFWFDLVVNFFFTYTNAYGAEIVSIGAICRHYLCGYFALNLIACLPEDAVRPLFGAFAHSSGEGAEEANSSTVHKITRISRLQRTTRLARLARLVRLARIAKLVAFVMNSIFWKWLMDMRGMRIVNFVVFLFWIVHILACGWYLCASLHDDYMETWLNRRPVDIEGTSLITRGPGEQWLHSCYFIFTVFTTVGFGDMSAMTTGEIVYVVFTMLVGAIVHSIIVSEMINILTFIDTTQLEIQKHREVIEGFTKHTHLDGEMRVRLTHWVEDLAQKGMLSQKYDREVMRDILTGGHLPHYLLKMLPRGVFQGKLLSNAFVRTLCSYAREVPPRLSLLVALALTPRQYVKYEVVYQFNDHPYHIFLVLDGIFADVGIPDVLGGKDESPFVGAHNALTALAAGAMVSRANSTHTASQMIKQATSPLNMTRTSPTRFWGRSLTQHGGNKSDTDGCSEATPMTPTFSENVNQGPKLYPYQLHCPGSYFGDIEFFEGGSRRCTVRCEGRTKTYTNPDGSFSDRSVRYGPSCALLLLHKQEFARILEEFPHYRKVWQKSAKRHERMREDQLGYLTCGRDVYSFAATQVSKVMPFYRRWKSKSKGAQSQTLKDPIAKVRLTPGDEERGALLPRSRRKSKTQPDPSAPSMKAIRETLQSELRVGLQEMRLELRSGIAQIREDLAVSDHPARLPEPVPAAPGLPAEDGASDVAATEVLALRAEVVRLRRELAEATHSNGSSLRDLAAEVEGTEARDALPMV